MIRFTVLYPNIVGSRFDHDYYRDRHLPMIQEKLGSSCRSYSIDRGLCGGEPDSEPDYVCMCHIFSDSVDALMTGLAPHAHAIEGDVPNYTDIVPIVQISDVFVGTSYEVESGDRTF